MGFDFYRQDGKYFGLNRSGWRMLFNIALLNGWEPMGTDHFNQGRYFYNDGQIICKEDAYNFAQALQASLENFKGYEEALLEEYPYKRIPNKMLIEMREKVREAIEFFQGGAIKIW